MYMRHKNGKADITINFFKEHSFIRIDEIGGHFSVAKERKINSKWQREKIA